jgi:hypothetical protein
MFVLSARRATNAAIATSEFAVAIPTRKTASKRAPATMNGFRRPHRVEA